MYLFLGIFIDLSVEVQLFFQKKPFAHCAISCKQTTKQVNKSKMVYLCRYTYISIVLSNFISAESMRQKTTFYKAVSEGYFYLSFNNR